MWTFIAALKGPLSMSSFGVSMPTQCFSGAVHSIQSHLSLSALANFSRSRIPNPPSFFGQQTFAQFTFHFPPLTEALQAHNIPLQILSKAFRFALSALIVVSKKIGSVVSTDLTRAAHPATLRNLAFQGLRLDIALSMYGCRSIRRSLPSTRGSPSI